MGESPSRAQMSVFLSFEGESAARMVNNLDWSGQMCALQLLRDVVHFRVGTMVKKEIGEAPELRRGHLVHRVLVPRFYRGLDFPGAEPSFRLHSADRWILIGGATLTSGTELIRRSRLERSRYWYPLITNS